MKTRVVHCKKEPYDVYIGRPSPFGNPYSNEFDTLAEFKVKNRTEAIKAYRKYAEDKMKSDPEFALLVRGLQAKVLGCWCKPKKCHGDILAELAYK